MSKPTALHCSAAARRPSAVASVRCRNRALGGPRREESRQPQPREGHALQVHHLVQHLVHPVAPEREGGGGSVRAEEVRSRPARVVGPQRRLARPGVGVLVPAGRALRRDHARVRRVRGHVEEARPRGGGPRGAAVVVPRVTAAPGREGRVHGQQLHRRRRHHHRLRLRLRLRFLLESDLEPLGHDGDAAVDLVMHRRHHAAPSSSRGGGGVKEKATWRPSGGR